ncbi:Endonuclease/Exonuclease/phosphatase family protein [Coniochaeta ligniaria NRRL 30616]|uniref:Endonuclease/Exonuclease/phosphatase family protein n=1 Tax=Coniochaeta ligniaria NRRL 30616 TaxID=1408157 RepID=A0A1J7J8F3_9PEZI|nr:Endonuclease/Exonuclease/phosphatase family protein [Coniochaeta ligniaria NRRL 30616]
MTERQLASQRDDTPLPADTADSPVIFQQWHAFDDTKGQWSPIDTELTQSEISSHTQPIENTNSSGNLVLLTWNVDGPSDAPTPRISAIMSRILDRTPTVNIIFLQEVTRAALSFITADSRIRKSWFLSHVNANGWEGNQYKSLTLLARSKFGQNYERPTRAALDSVWRIKYPSLFGRDGLCCDVFVPSCPSASSSEGPVSADMRVRLVNVHLDSRKTHQARRRQVSVVSSFLRCVGRGVVAGDFNAVQAEDETLIEDCGLMDAWTGLHHEEPGFTWGVDGKQRHPQARLDKVATVGLSVKHIEVVHPGFVTVPGAAGEEELTVPWSDHSGLICTFEDIA